MKKLLLLAILLGASFSTLTFAQETTTGASDTNSGVITTGTVQMNQEQIRANWKEFHENFGHAGLYLNRNLTDTEKMDAKLVITTRIQSMETLNLEIRTALRNGETIDRDSYKAKIAAIYTAFQTEFTPFVDESKVEVFGKFIEERVAMINTNRGLRLENHQIKETKKIERQEKKEIKKDEHLQKKAVKVGARAERLRGIIGNINNGFLTSIMKQLDHLATKAKTEESKQMILDIKLLIEDKLGLLNLDEDGNVIDEDETETSTDSIVE